MSEVTNKLRRMLSQAHGFTKDAPSEALTRARLAVSSAEAALAGAVGEEREQLQNLHALALSRVEKYALIWQAWTAGVQERSDLYNRHERERLEQPIATKG